MLDYIVGLFEWVGTMFYSLLAFVETFFRGILDLFRYLPPAMTMLANAVGFLPSILVSFASIALLVSVLLFVLGRN